jgi:hypothetical protein
VGVEVFDLRFEIRRLPDVVVVEEGNEFAARQFEAAVTGASRATTPFHRQDLHFGTLGMEPRDGRIDRAVIHNDDLEISEALTVHSRQRALELPEPISRRHHHRDTRRHNDCLPRLVFIALVLPAGRLGITVSEPDWSRIEIITELRNTAAYLS